MEEKDNLYKVYKQYCGFHDIVCLGSLRQDLMIYYNINHTNEEIEFVADSIRSYLDYMWSNLDKIKDTNNEKLDSDKLIIAENGYYKNVYKIDFKKAFTNYSISRFSNKAYRKLNEFNSRISTLSIPSSAKKYLFNYSLTNLIKNELGSKTLYELRKTVYNNILNEVKNIGIPIRSESDGCYFQIKDDIKFDSIMVGKQTTKKFKFFIISDTMFGGLLYNNKVVLKGINNNLPNIYKKTLISFLKERTDDVIDRFFYSDKMNVLDWCGKSSDGKTVNLFIGSNKVELGSESTEDILSLNDLSDKINRSKYYNELSTYINSILMLDVEQFDYNIKRGTLK